MINKKISGNALTQYGIIIVLIALALIPILIIFGKNITDQLNFFLSKATEGNRSIEKNIQNNSNSKIKPGELGGSIDQPKSRCISGNCTIDFGLYVLDGIPEDFQEFAHSNGASGGTEKLFSLIDQIIKQLEDEGKTDEAKELKDIANLGHFIANLQKTTEDQIKNCLNNNNGNDTYCAENATDLISLNATNDEIKNLLDYSKPAPGFSPINIKDYIDIGLQKHKIEYPGISVTETENYPVSCDKNPACQLIKKTDSFLSNPKYSDDIKSISKQILLFVNDLNFDFSGKLDSWYCTAVSCKISNFQKADPFTGEYLPNTRFNCSNNKDFLEPQVSFTNDLNSALICTVGKYDDNGKKCN